MIETPILDPRNEALLTQQAKNYAFQASNGLLNDFSEANPLDVLIRSQAYVGAELLHYVNGLPLALALRLLSLTGEVRQSGTKASCTVEFELIAPSAGLFLIPEGFEVSSSSLNSNLTYYTITDLLIPIGQTKASVIVEAKDVGSKYNAEIGQINRFTLPLSGLKSVVNIEKATGTDTETDDEIIDRAIKSIRRRAPISVIDFEEFAVETLGRGYAKCIPTLSQDKNNEEPGSVHVFILDSSGNQPTIAQINQVQTQLDSQKHAGTKVYVSPLDLVDIDGFITAKLLDGYNPIEVSSVIWQEFQTFFNYQNFKAGESILINKVEFSIALIEGIEYVDVIEINGSNLNQPLPNDWSFPKVLSLEVNLITAVGSIYKQYFGMTEPLDNVP